ncbi:FAD-binding oxidoreductase [soil metagenome]
MDWPDFPTDSPIGDGRYAQATDHPETAEALSKVVTQRVSEGGAIYPIGGSTALNYGGPPSRPGFAIDLRGLCRVIDYPVADMTITVEAGRTLSDLQATLAEHGQRLTLEAPRPDLATLGGIYATDTSGPRRFGLGRPRDQVLGVRFVNGAGEFVKGGGRVVKNVAGYDFPRLLTGSLGTLGILCELTLKVRPRPESSAIAWAPRPDAATVEADLERLNTSATRPVALDLLNRSAARIIGGPIGLPEANWVLVSGFEGNSEAVAWQLEALRAELPGSDVSTLQDDASALLWSALVEFQAIESGPLTFKANVRPSALLPILKGLDPERWAVQCHAGNGIAWGQVLGQEPALEEVAEEIVPLRREAVADGGNLILPRCPTPWKSRLGVWGEPRGDWVVAERIKQALDPLGVMHPGRFVGTL